MDIVSGHGSVAFILWAQMATTERHDALQVWKEFLESAPAYVQRKIPNLLVDVHPSVGQIAYGIRSPKIQLYCEIDDGIRWFDCAEDKIYADKYRTEFISYTCRDCGRWDKLFAVILSPDPADKLT